MPEESKLAAALRECEEACPCLHMNYACGPLVCKCKIRIMAYSATATDTQPPTANVLCSWPGHAAITRYGDLREKEGYERGYNESKVCVCHIPSEDPCPRHP